MHLTLSIQPFINAPSSALFHRMQTSHSKESTELMLMVSYLHDNISPILTAFVLAALCSTSCNIKAFVAAVNRRMDLHDNLCSQ